MVSDLSSSILFRLNGAYFDKDYSEYQMKNAKACKAAAIKMIDVMNKSLDNPMFSNDELFGMVFASIKRVLERDDAIEVMKRINTGFIPTFS